MSKENTKAVLDIEKTETPAAPEAPEAPKNQKMVKIKLHRGKSRQDTADVFVSVNGERYQIQRGVEVEVPYYIAEVLENSERQDYAAARYKEKMARNLGN